MLQLTVLGREYWDEKTNEFITTKDVTLSLEHSLVSISKWESKWHKPFISDKNKTNDEMFDYIRCMTITQNVDSKVYYRFTNENISQIKEYIEDTSTATWFSEAPNAPKSTQKKEQITSELVYYWMTAFQIPFECEKWHFNRLMTLIRICNIKNKPPKKQNKRDIMRNNASLNAARRNSLGTSG